MTVIAAYRSDDEAAQEFMASAENPDHLSVYRADVGDPKECTRLRSPRHRHQWPNGLSRVNNAGALHEHKLADLRMPLPGTPAFA